MRSPSTREFPSLRLLCTRVKSISKELALVKRKFHLLKPRRSFHNNLVMWVCCMTLYYINYIAWAPPKNYEYLFNIHTFKLNLKFWVELYSRHCSQENLFVIVLVIEHSLHSITITKNIDIIHNILTIHIVTIHYSCKHQIIFSK